MTRSMPSISGSGKARPQSTTRISPAASMAVMFLPTSPTPPSGMMRRVSVMGAPSEESHLFVVARLRCRCHGLGHARTRDGRCPSLHIGAFRLDRLAGGEQRRRQATHVAEERLPQRGLMQRRSGMVHREDEAAAILAKAAVD